MTQRENTYTAASHKIEQKRTKIKQTKGLQPFQSGAIILESFFDSANSISVALN